MNPSINPINFTKSFLQENARYIKQKGVSPDSFQASGDELWLNEYLQGTTEKLPNMETFDRDIKKLEKDDPSGQSSSLYCGLAVLAASVAASQVGSISPGSPLFASISAVIGKSLIPPDQDNKLGEEMNMAIKSNVDFYTDPDMNKRLNRVGKNILKHSTLPESDYEFHVLDQDAPNAYTAPGHIYFTRKMMEILETDAQLAFFIGHETAHMEDRDHAETLGHQHYRELVRGTLMMRDQNMVDKTVGDYRRETLNNFKESSIDYDRENEFSADRRGVQLMAKAGYSPEESLKAITIPDNIMKELGHKWDPEKSKHPETSKRLVAIREEVDKITVLNSILKIEKRKKEDL